MQLRFVFGRIWKINYTSNLSLFVYALSFFYLPYKSCVITFEYWLNFFNYTKEILCDIVTSNSTPIRSQNLEFVPLLFFVL